MRDFDRFSSLGRLESLAWSISSESGAGDCTGAGAGGLDQYAESCSTADRFPGADDLVN